jgi:hypothetical protein
MSGHRHILPLDNRPGRTNLLRFTNRHNSDHPNDHNRRNDGPHWSLLWKLSLLPLRFSYKALKQLLTTRSSSQLTAENCVNFRRGLSLKGRQDV